MIEILSICCFSRVSAEKLNHKKLELNQDRTMDLSNILQENDDDLTRNLRTLRTKLYIKFSNSSNALEMCRRTIASFRTYLRSNVLKCAYDQDFLNILVRKDFWQEMGSEDAEHVLVRIGKNVNHAFPKIHIPSDIISKSNLRTADLELDGVGCQEIINLTDVSEDEHSLTSSDTDQESRTCKRAKIIECPDAPGLLQHHRKNERKMNDCTTVYVDILIYIFDKTIASKISKFFGFICLDQILKESHEKDIEDKITVKNSKIYTLIQTLITKSLIYGANNICLTTSEVLFENIQAIFKSIIIREQDRVNMLVKSLQETANHVTFIEGKNSLLDHTEAVSEIINAALMTDASVLGYFKEEENEISRVYQVNIPLASVIPLHVLRYASQKKLMEDLQQSRIQLFG